MTGNSRQQHGVRAGITLIEVLVVVGITLFLLPGIILFQQNIIRSSKATQRNLLAEQEVRRTLNNFLREVRSASPSSGGAYPIESAGTSSLVFFSNIDGDAAVERIRYFLATGTSPTVYDTIKRGVIEPVGGIYITANESESTVVRSVLNSSTTPLFSYYDSTYDGTNAALSVPIGVASVRLIKMDIRINEETLKSPVARSYSVQTMLRNLKDNF